MVEIKKKKYQVSGGTVHRESSVYVERNHDNKIIEILLEKEEVIIITSGRQCGKTSLVHGVVNEFKKNKNTKCIFIDLRSCPGTPKQEDRGEQEDVWWFKTLFYRFGNDLGVKWDDINNWLQDEKISCLSHTAQFESFFEDFIRKQQNITERILIAIDELDQFQTYGYYTDDFFSAINTLYDKKNEISLSFILVCINHPSLLVKLGKQSSFKVGTTIRLEDFESNNINMLKWSEGLNIEDDNTKIEIVNEVFRYTGGHPYLNVLILAELAKKKSNSIEDILLVINSLEENVEFKNHLKAPFDFITHNQTYTHLVLDTYRKILNQPVKTTLIEELVLHVLRASGLVKLNESGEFEPRNELYKLKFNENWCKQVEKGIGSRDWFDTQRLANYKRRKKPHICILNTGGTIGMVEIMEQIVAPTDIEFANIYPEVKAVADTNFIGLNAKDGAYMYPEDWVQIAQAIYDRRNNEYDGFIVAHGTDTLAYTASAVAFALGPGLNVPVVFVGAQAPHTVKYGDALINLLRACEIIRMKEDVNIAEVVICFGDKVLRAVRAQKYNDYLFDGFHSPTLPPLAIISEQIEVRNDLLIFDETKKMECKNSFETNVLQIHQYPGLNPKMYEQLIDAHPVKGIIIESLGLGNLPTRDKDIHDKKYNLLPFIEKAILEKNIPVIISSKYPIQPEFIKKYIPATASLQKGAISVGNMTSAAAYVKLAWILPQIEKEIETGDLPENKKMMEIQRLMTFNYIGEVDKIYIEKLDNDTDDDT